MDIITYREVEVWFFIIMKALAKLLAIISGDNY